MPRIVVTAPDKNPQPYRFGLDSQVVTMGRAPENDIIIDCGSVSLRHAEMHRIKGGYELRDLGSTNGISLNEAYHKVIPLLNGLNVKVGDAIFDFSLTEAESDALEAEKKELTTPVVRPLPAPSFNDDYVAPLPRRRQSATYDEPEESNSGSLGAFVLGITLFVLAFFIGLHLRHQKETGGSLIDAIKNKSINSASPAQNR